MRPSLFRIFNAVAITAGGRPVFRSISPEDTQPSTATARSTRLAVAARSSGVERALRWGCSGADFVGFAGAWARLVRASGAREEGARAGDEAARGAADAEGAARRWTEGPGRDAGFSMPRRLKMSAVTCSVSSRANFAASASTSASKDNAINARLAHSRDPWSTLRADDMA